MQAIRRMDAWFGLRIMHPPIIWFCQRWQITQWRFSRDIWFFAWVAILEYQLYSQGSITALTGCLCGFMFLRAIILPQDRKSEPSFGFRLLSVCTLFCITIPMIVVLGASIMVLPPGVLIVIGEYALTITDIPPRNKKEKEMVLHA